jgi:hypothetical protein
VTLTLSLAASCAGIQIRVRNQSRGMWPSVAAWSHVPGRDLPFVDRQVCVVRSPTWPRCRAARVSPVAM